MPIASKRRRTTDDDDPDVLSASTPPKRRSIRAYGKISKSQLDHPQSGKRKVPPEKPHSQPGGNHHSTIFAGAGTGMSGDVEPEPSPSITLPGLSKSPSKAPSLTAHPSTAETPTKGVRSCLAALAVVSPSSTSQKSPLPARQQRSTPASSPVRDRSPSSSPQSNSSACQSLPVELQDLANLHSSLLTALSLHYIHNGQFTPADLRVLGPAVERSWRKRRVTTEDVRRVLAISQETGGGGGARALLKRACGLSLWDFGGV